MEHRGRIRGVPSGVAGDALVPPHDLDAERAVIGAMLVSETAVSVVGEMLVAEDFYSETHRVLYGAMMRLYSRGDPIDQLTLTNELRNMGEFDRIGGRQYVFRIVESVPTAANAARYAEIVRGKALLRAVIDAGSRIQQEAFTEPEDVTQALDAAEQLIYGVSNRQLKQHLAPLSELAPGALEMVQRLYEAEDEVTGVESGFEDLDQKTTGFHKSDLVVLAARPAMGKTALALNILWHAAGAKGLPVAVFSLEMSKAQLVQRLISQTTRIRTQDLRSGNVKAEDWPKLVRGVAEVSRAPIWIDDTAGITLMEMRAKVRRLASRLHAQVNAEGQSGPPLSLVVVDYLQLMVGQGNRSENRQQEIAEISRGLKVLARDLDVPVLAIAQLSRAVEARHDKRPLLSDLRDSGAIEQDADLVMFLYRDEYYNTDSDDKGIAEVIIGKHRNGPTGKVQLAWLEQYTKFASLAPLAPREWPRFDLVAETRALGFMECIAQDSGPSPATVPVPCGLMYPICSGCSPADLTARAIARPNSRPSGSGSVRL